MSKDPYFASAQSGLRLLAIRRVRHSSYEMRRRSFLRILGVGTAVWPIVTHAQQRERIRRVGWLQSGAESYPHARDGVVSFRQELSNLGWIEGRNLRIDYRWYSGDGDRLYKDAAELVALNPDVIMVGAGAALGRLLEVSRTVPVVFAEVNEPLVRGFVASLARPGGNATGFTHLEFQTSAKWAELLKEMAPAITRVAVIGGAHTAIDSRGQWEAIQSAAPALKVEPISVVVRDMADIERGIATYAASEVGLIVTQNIVTAQHHEFIVSLAARHHLPAVYFARFFVAEGGLISYAPDISEQYQRAAQYVDRVLRGSKPADLPVQQPIKYQTAVNMRTAKALGIDVPTSILLRATEIIE